MGGREGGGEEERWEGGREGGSEGENHREDCGESQMAVECMARDGDD